MTASGVNKVRVGISVTADTKTLLDAVIADELKADQSNDRPERSQSEILKMVLRRATVPGSKNTNNWLLK